MSMLKQLLAVVIALFALAAAAQAQEWNTNRPGQDYREFELAAPDYSICQNQCARDAKCKAWTFAKPSDKRNKARCILKSGVPAKVKNDCCVSGVVAADNDDRDRRCRDYADQAVTQNAEAQRLRCGFGGERWQSSRAAHIEFCQRVTPAQANREAKMREDQLAACRKSAGGGGSSQDATCRDYANEAVQQYQQSRLLNCGFGGDAWHQDFARHFNWCMVAPRDRREAERNLRSRNLTICRGTGGSYNREDACRAYSEQAVQQSTENRSLSCGIAGDRWHTNYDRHFNWCMSVSGDALNSDREDRARAIRRCREERRDGDADRSVACRTFADEAVAQNDENRRLACGFTGFRWQPSAANLYSWCMSVDRTQRDAETRARETSLARCRADTGGSGTSLECRDYAWRSVDQAERNRSLGCGFEGPDWRVSLDDHLYWCRSAPPSARQRMIDSRQQLLKLCTSNAERRPLCRSYANRAVSQQRDNMAWGCGLNGSRWHSNYSDHFVWCMGALPGLRDLETVTRDQALAACRR